MEPRSTLQPLRFTWSWYVSRSKPTETTAGRDVDWNQATLSNRYGLPGVRSHPIETFRAHRHSIRLLEPSYTTSTVLGEGVVVVCLVTGLVSRAQRGQRKRAFKAATSILIRAYRCTQYSDTCVSRRCVLSMSPRASSICDSHSEFKQSETSVRFEFYVD